MKLLHNTHGFSAIEVAIIVIAMGFVGSSGYYVYQKNQDQSEQTTNAVEAESDAPLANVDLDAFLSDLQSKTEATYSEINATNVVANDELTSPRIMYTAEDYEYKVELARSAAYIRYTPKDYNAVTLSSETGLPNELSETVVAALQSAGAQLVTNPPINVEAFNSGALGKGDYYAFKNAVCYLSGDSRGDAVFDITCGHYNDFSRAAAELQPFVTASLNDLADYNLQPDNMLFSEAEYGEQREAGVSYAMVAYQEAAGVQGSAYFYKQSSANNWTFYETSKNGLHCDAITEPEPQAAFATICITAAP